MPTIQLYSDLHLEFYARKPGKLDKFLRDLDATDVDVVVLAGDICAHRQFKRVLGRFAEVYPHVVYVIGNHEYYGGRPAEVHQILQEVVDAHDNLHWLDCKTIEVAGLKFCGGTLWYPHSEDPRIIRAKHQVADGRHILDFEPWVFEQHERCMAALEAGASDADVVVTHHIPSGSCISRRFRLTGPVNHYFCHDLTTRIEKWQPALWLFGHTHDRMWTFIGDTRVVCNPKGYPHEQGSKIMGRYVERCLIDLSDVPIQHARSRGRLTTIRSPYPGQNSSGPVG